MKKLVFEQKIEKSMEKKAQKKTTGGPRLTKKGPQGGPGAPIGAPLGARGPFNETLPKISSPANAGDEILLTDYTF